MSELNMATILRRLEKNVYVFWFGERFFFGKIKNGAVHELEFEEIESSGWDDVEGVGTCVYKINKRKTRCVHSNIALNLIDGELSLDIIEWSECREEYFPKWGTNLKPVDTEKCVLHFAYN